MSDQQPPRQPTPQLQPAQQLQPPQQPSVPFGAPPAPAATKAPKRAWYKRTWAIATITGLVGLGIGASAAGGAPDPATTPEYKSLAKELAQSKAGLEAANAKVTEVQGDLPAREAAVKKAESAVAAREKAVTAAEKDVAKREKKVGLVEQEIAANTVGGDGMYKVGADMKPGTYKTAGSVGCYYAVLDSTDTFDIAENNNIDGPGFATVRAGQYFETARCADWTLQK